MTTLTEYTKADLLALAEQFGSEVKPTMSKADIVAVLELDGVTPEFVAEQKAREEEPEDAALLDDAPLEPLSTNPDDYAKADDDDVVLIRMLRRNPTYEVRGHVFRASHPFALVKETDADFLIEELGGFRMASPKEAREFYS